MIVTDTVVSKAGSGSGSFGVGFNRTYLVAVVYTGESVLCRVLYQVQMNVFDKKKKAGSSGSAVAENPRQRKVKTRNVHQLDAHKA